MLYKKFTNPYRIVYLVIITNISVEPMRSTMPVAFKFGYNGRAFDGYALQNIKDPPDTVEGRILGSLGTVLNREALGPAELAQEITFRSASRTDKCVSALGNVISLDVDKDPEELALSLNALVKDCFFWAYTDVKQDFKPRFANSRWYRYYLARGLQDFEIRRLHNAAQLFYGEHDFARFCKKDASDPGKSTIREIHGIEITTQEGVVVIDIKANRFLWHMVRKIVWALERAALDEMSIASVYNHLDEGADEQEIGLAPAEPLVLMDVEYEGVKFTRVPGIKKEEMLKRMISLKDELNFLDLALEKVIE